MMNNVFKEFREFTHLSQSQAAKEVDVTRNCWSMWETWKRRPSPEKAANFLAFAETMKFPVSYARLYQKPHSRILKEVSNGQNKNH